MRKPITPTPVEELNAVAVEAVPVKRGRKTADKTAKIKVAADIATTDKTADAAAEATNNVVKAARNKAAAKKDEAPKAARGKAAAKKDKAPKAARGRAAAKKDEAPKAARGRAAAKKKILFAVSEVAPFISTGGMGQVVSSLPTHLQLVNKKLDVRVISPLYQQVEQQYGAGMEFLGSAEVQLAWRSLYCGVFRVVKDGITYYFLDNKHYFDREGVYGYFDDGERFAFFSRAVLSVLELIGFVPDVIHVHDWQTALIPIYLKTSFADKYPGIRSILTIHNIEYQGRFPLTIMWDVFCLRNEDYPIVEYQSCINLIKGAIVCCDRFTTVSPSYAEEIKYDGAFGLEPIIRLYENKLSGIINGIDTELYNPATDPSLTLGFSADSLEDKAVNKRALQTLFSLPAEPRAPLICMISRLVPHKGLDLLLPIMDEILSDHVQFFILGTGDSQYELFFNELALRYPTKVGVSIAYNPSIGSKIYGGSDIMLMPSRNEPCGLSQMIACRYGTVPIVRATGGLRDTVRDCRTGDGNGFLFVNYNSGELLRTIRQAIDMYTFHQDDWQNLMREAMRGDFSWNISAKAYAAMYTGLR